MAQDQELKNMFQQMQEELERSRSERESLQKEIQQLNSRIANTEKQLPDVVSNIEEIMRRNIYAEEHKDERPLVLREFSGYDYDRKKDVRKEIPFKGKKNLCPYCTEHKKPSLLDLTRTGRWSCRSCGKTWVGEALGQPYSKALERFVRTDDDSENKLQTILGMITEEKQKDKKIETLEQELSEVKNLILQLSLGNGKKK